MSARLSLCLCTSLVLAVPSLALAEPAQTERSRIRVVVVADAVGEAGPVFEDEADASLRAALEEAGYELDDSIRADATVRLRIEFFNEADLDYQIKVDIAARGQLVQFDALACPQCDDAALLDKIQGHQGEILAELEGALAKAAQGQPSTTSDAPPPTPEPPEPTPKPKPIGALGGVGIGVAVLGVGALVAGGVELGRGRVYDERGPTPPQRAGVDHRPAGGALLGVGGVMFAAGATMLVVDLVRSRKQHRAQAGLAQPLLGPDLVGLGYSGRF